VTAEGPALQDLDDLRCRQGHSEIVGMLLEAGIDVNQRYKNDLTALMWAAGYGRGDTARLLLQKAPIRT